MYIAGVYNQVSGATIIDNDIRCEEVRKLLTSFSKDSYARVTYYSIDIMVDSTVIYKAMLKTPPINSLPIIYIDTKFMIENNIPEDKLINCPWVEQNFLYIDSRINFGPKVAQYNDLRSDPEFERLMNLKADDGMKFYKIPGFDKNKVYMIPVFSGFPNLNKQDTASVDIYANDGISVIVDMTIYKKKLNRDIHMIYKVLDITN